MKQQEYLKKIAKKAMLYAHDELKDNHAPVEEIVAAAFLNGIYYAEHHPRWISVEDDTPKETNMYIVVRYNAVCTMLWYSNAEEWADIYVDENGNICSRRMDGITHWMPLPQPPKKGGTRLPYEKDEIKGNQGEISPNRIIGTPEHIQVALDVIDKKGGEQ